MTIVRLNYAIEPRYGVLTDLAQRVIAGEPIDLSMGHVNIIWQRDACAAILEMFAHVSVPPLVVNVTGTERLSVRSLAERLAHEMGREVGFAGSESPDALLSDATLMTQLVGAPETDVDTMIEAVAHWARDGQPVLVKPTHFETRDGSF